MVGVIFAFQGILQVRDGKAGLLEKPFRALSSNVFRSLGHIIRQGNQININKAIEADKCCVQPFSARGVVAGKLIQRNQIIGVRGIRNNFVAHDLNNIEQRKYMPIVSGDLLMCRQKCRPNHASRGNHLLNHIIKRIGARGDNPMRVAGGAKLNLGGGKRLTRKLHDKKSNLRPLFRWPRAGCVG
nr:MAG TPA: hypothetical protein [Caudoviricetes sp.]